MPKIVAVGRVAPWGRAPAGRERGEANEAADIGLGDDGGSSHAGKRGGALAATINGTEGSDTLQGTSGADYIYGKGGDDTIEGSGLNDHIEGGPGNDTLRGGPQGEAYRDHLIGGPGDDFINATDGTSYYRDIVFCNEGFDRVWYGPNDYVYQYYAQASGPGCESMLRTDARTSGQVKGAFYREGSSVTFDSYPVSGGDVSGGKPYDKKTTSSITVNGKPLSLTVDPKQKTITQAAYTQDGYYNKLTEADKQAVGRAYTELIEFLDPQDSCGGQNQESLVLRHFALLADSSNNEKLKNFDKTYEEPRKRCDGTSNTNVSASIVPNASPVNDFIRGVTSIGAKRCPAEATGESRSAKARFARFSGPIELMTMPHDRYIPIQSAEDDDITYLPCDSSTERGYYTDQYGTPGYSDAQYGPATEDPTGRCGDEMYGVEFSGYTQDCLDHDLCARTFEEQDDDSCSDELGQAFDDFVNTGINLAHTHQGD